VTIFDTLVIYF